MGEGHGRYLGAWSGYLRILRRKGCGTDGGVVLGTGESLLGPVSAGMGSMSAYNRCSREMVDG